MTLAEIKEILNGSETIGFQLPDGSLVPSHFHVTEVGKVHKDFIDCGGKRRQEEVISMQLWDSSDYDHRLHPEKLLHIIELSERVLELGNLPIEVEYQGTTIGKYSLGHSGGNFQLLTKETACLANDGCGIPIATQMVASSAEGGCCTPESGCC